MTSWSRPKIRARQIADADVPGVVDALVRGFPRRSRAYWQRGMGRLAAHPTPPGFPRYGYLMESDGAVVGVILLITTTVRQGDSWTTRCNVSSWYVDPPYRSHASLLIAQALRDKSVTYLNVSPAPHTWPILEAQGYTRYSNGLFVAPALPAFGGARPQVVGIDALANARLDPYERDLMAAHAGYGCMALWFETPERTYPFVFASRVVKRIAPCAQLIYCRDVEDFVAFARPIGSFLIGRGRPVVLIDANGPIRGLPGKFLHDIAPKYFKGPVRPRLGDIAYSEAALFGL